MFKDWLQSTQLLLLRFRVSESSTIFRPRFALTSLVLWCFAIFGLLYGHVFRVGESARALSLLLSGIAGFGAVFLISLHDTQRRLRVFGRQVWGLMWLISFLILVAIASVIWRTEAAAFSIKLTWLIGTLLVGFVGARLSYRAYLQLEDVTEYYSGMRSASILVALFVVNYLLWSAQSFLVLVK